MVILTIIHRRCCQARVPGVSHGSCIPCASLGAVSVTAQGLWPVSERGLKSAVLLLLLPATGEHLPWLCAQAVLGEPALSAPSNFQCHYWVPGRRSYLLSPVRAHLCVQVGLVLWPLCCAEQPLLSTRAAWSSPQRSVLTLCLHPTSPSCNTLAILAQQMRLKPWIYSGVMNYR